MPTLVRMCPVCEEIGQIGYGKKTCSSECGKKWVMMSKAEQKARLNEASLTDEDRVRRLRDEVMGLKNLPHNQAEQGEQPNEPQFDRSQVDPSLWLPEGIIPGYEGDKPKKEEEV